MVFSLVGIAVVLGQATAGGKILIEMSNWTGYAPLYLAERKGFFKDEGWMTMSLPLQPESH
jgi:ABC-type nitrate/sulfonate/bicarbonate transport system substrate-binding protein